VIRHIRGGQYLYAFLDLVCGSTRNACTNKGLARGGTSTGVCCGMYIPIEGCDLVQAAMIRMHLRPRRSTGPLACSSLATSQGHPISWAGAAPRRPMDSRGLSQRPENPSEYHRTLSTSSSTTSSSSATSSRPSDADGPPKHQPNRHAQFYRDFVPAMIPIFLIGSAVYVSLQLAQSYLSHEKYATEARARITELERELRGLRAVQGQQSSPSPSSSAPTQNSGFLRWWG